MIKTVELYKLRVPLKEPFVISLGTIFHVENVIVIIRTEDGCAGYGECSPYMTINGESIDKASALLPEIARLNASRLRASSPSVPAKAAR